MRHYPLILILFTLFLCTGQRAIAKSPNEVRFRDITITTSNTHLLLFGIVSNYDSDTMEKALHSGIPMKFTFYVELFRTRNNWPDDELMSREFSHTLQYDSLKEQYRVELEENKNKTTTFTPFAEALELMDEINGLKVIELDKLLPDNSYELRIKAELYEKTLPMSLHYVIPFVSFWDIATNWHTIEFTY
jgi:hypothetical protein